MNEAIPQRFPVLPGLVILEKLGAGAVGSIYLARSEALGRLVAVKVLRRELAGNRLYVERLRREARLSARLDHPNIVKGLDLGEAEGVPFFVMEFVDGKSLKTVLRERGRLEEDEVLEFGLQLCRGLDHAYRSGVVHRDIKPGNLMIARDGTLKIADLGLARRPDDSSVTRDGVTLGTPHYISPEQARDPSSADVRSDLYSVGATLFHMIMGRPAFDGETVAEVLSKVWDENLVPDMPGDIEISKNLELVIRRLLSKDPNRRYQTPDDLLRDLERVKRRERPNVSIFDINPKAKKVVMRSVLGVALAAVLGAGVFGIAHLVNRSDTSGPSRTAVELAAKLAAIEKESSDAPHALLDRWRRVDALLATVALLEADRVRAVDQKGKIENQLSAVASGLERACEQELAKAIGDRDLAAAEDLVHAKFPGRFQDSFGADASEFPRALAARVQQFLDAREAEVARAVEAAEGRLVEALPAFLIKKDAQANLLLAEGRYKSTLALANDALNTFDAGEGASWRQLPAAARERVASRAIARMDELRARVLQSARDSLAGISLQLRREHDRLDEAVRAGLVASAAAAFEEFASRALEEMHYREEEWPEEAGRSPEKLIKELSSSLHSLERQRERDVADRAFAEHDARLAARWKERQYSAVRDEWRARAARATVPAIRERIERRIRYADLLSNLRERVMKNVEARKGKKIQLALRSGEAVAGKIITMTLKDDDGAIQLQEGTRPEVRFSALAAADALGLAELADSQGDRVMAAVFWLAEGEYNQSQAQWIQARERAGGAAAVSGIDIDNALLDVDTLRALSLPGGGDRDRRFDDARKRAAGYVSIGEFDLAREWLDRAKQEAAGFLPGDPRIGEIDRLAKEFEAREKAARKLHDLAQAFPGAAIREMQDGRLELRYDAKGLAAICNIEDPLSWTKTPSGIDAARAPAPDVDVARWPAARVVLPALGKGPLRVHLKCWIPFEGMETGLPVRVVSVLGRNVIFAGGKSRGRPFTVVRTGGLDGIDSEIESLIVEPPAGEAIGLLRGSLNEILFEIDENGRSWTVSLDGTRLHAISASAPIGTVIELRANSPIEWRDLRIEGVTPPKR